MTGPVRPPAVAGSFYPGSPGELRRLVDALFAAAADLPGARLPAAAAGDVRPPGPADRPPRAPCRPRLFRRAGGGGMAACLRTRSGGSGDPARGRAPWDQPPRRLARWRRRLGGRRLGTCRPARSRSTPCWPPRSLPSGRRSTWTGSAPGRALARGPAAAARAPSAPGRSIVPLAVSAGTGAAGDRGGRASWAAACGTSFRGRPGRPRDQLRHGALPAGRRLRAGDGDAPAGDPGPRPGAARVHRGGHARRGNPRARLRHVRDRARHPRPRGAAGDGSHREYGARLLDVRGRWRTAGPDRGLPRRSASTARPHRSRSIAAARIGSSMPMATPSSARHLPAMCQC